MATTSSTSEQLQIEALLNGPAGRPPAGTLPDFHKAAGLRSVFYLTIALGIAFSSSAVLVRIYTKHFLLRSMGYDDYSSIFAWLSVAAYFAITCLIVKAGVGVHMWDLQLKDFFRLLHLLYLESIAYGTTAFFAKVSILFQYSRIFNPTGRGNLPLFVAIRIGILSIFTLYFVIMFLDIFQCIPIEKSWNKLITTGHCFDFNAAYKTTGIFNVLSDFAILIMPMPCVWNLNMPLRKKLLTMGVFGLGFLVCLTSIMRTHSTWRFVESPDKSYYFGTFGLWSTAELAIGIITGCLSVMPRFIQHVGPKLHELFSVPSTPASISGQDPKSKAFNPTTLTKIKIPLGRHSTVLGTPDADSHPYAQPQGEYRMLDDFGASQHQADRDPIPAPGGGATTRRDDLEHGHQRF